MNFAYGAVTTIFIFIYPSVKLCHVRNPILFDYRINEICQERVTLMKDLGVLYDEKLTFTDHISFITSKSSSMLCFVLRICKDFDDVLLLKI